MSLTGQRIGKSMAYSSAQVPFEIRATTAENGTKQNRQSCSRMNIHLVVGGKFVRNPVICGYQDSILVQDVIQVV
jgi:hypothetical protein